MMEEWRVISDYPNYDVSNLGNIRNNKSSKDMKKCAKGGYFHVSLINENNIWGVITNYRKTAGGFIFKYLEDLQ